MAINNVDSAGATNIRTLEQTRKVGNELGKDAFLQILVAQMANQDPLSPTSDTEFIAQMAQFSSLEQMQNMNAAMQSQKAYGYLGKEITANYAVDGEGNLYHQEVYGQVMAVVKFNGMEYLQVQDYFTGNLFLVPPDQVMATMSNSIEQRLAALTALLGQVVANTAPKTDTEPEEETGQAEGVDPAGQTEQPGDQAGDAAYADEAVGAQNPAM